MVVEQKDEMRSPSTESDTGIRRNDGDTNCVIEKRHVT
jgi:hypothetical protein